jgi:BirA family biotin operon repressor/biotin-[acetyl-CoA-carboxylase] ligase
LSPPEFPHTQPLPDELARPLAAAASRLGPLARQIMWYSKLSSTNDLAAAFAERGVREGCVIIADTQTAGRGRHGRPWCSPPGAGLYVSLVMRPPQRVVPLLTVGAGVAIAEGIRAATGLAPALKWPNDVHVGSRKLAGILAEAGSIPGGAQHVVLGFGINVLPAAYPREIAERATSLEGELGRSVDRGAVLAECLAALAARYDDLQRGRPAIVLDAWRAFARPMFGRPVEWDGREGTQRGVAEDVDDSGALVVRTEAGRARLISGEIRWS